MSGNYAALIALGGVIIGAVIGTFPALNAQAEQRRQQLLGQLDRLLAALADVDSAVQAWHVHARLYSRVEGDAKHRELEKAGAAAGRIATMLIALEGLAHAVDPNGSVGRAADEFVVHAREQARNLPLPGISGPEEVAFVARRQDLVREISQAMHRVHEARIPLRDRVTGTFRLPRRG